MAQEEALLDVSDYLEEEESGYDRSWANETVCGKAPTSNPVTLDDDESELANDAENDMPPDAHPEMQRKYKSPGGNLYAIKVIVFYENGRWGG